MKNKRLKLGITLKFILAAGGVEALVMFALEAVDVPHRHILNPAIDVSILIIVIIVTFYYFVGKPLATILQAILSFEKGDLDARAEIKTNDEMGVLAHAFNQMAADIKERSEAAEVMNEELRTANEEAQEAREAAEQQAEQLERFNKVAVGRELKMRDLKERIKELEGKISKQ